MVGPPNDGNHNGPRRSFLGMVNEHDNGMADLLTDEEGIPLVFSPRDINDGGNMVMWDDAKGGRFPWDANYFKQAGGLPVDPYFEPEFIMQHATGSANSASAYSTGTKTGFDQMGVDLYERPVRNILEDAQSCGKSGGIVTSVPILHASPGAFVTHTNYRNNRHQLQDGFRETQPTWATGICAVGLEPSAEQKQSMINGSLSSTYTFLHQDPVVMADDFYDTIQNNDPDSGDKVVACFGGQYSKGKCRSCFGGGAYMMNMPYRGLDSSYTGRW